MKRILSIILIFFASLCFVHAQYDCVFEELPSKYQKGVVIYPYNDSMVFIFNALDYNKLWLKDIEDVKEGRMDLLKLADEFSSAHNRKSTVMRNSELFPNSHIFIKLFKSKKMFVFESNAQGKFQKINYRVRIIRKLGFVKVIKRGEKIAFYEKAYKRIN